MKPLERLESWLGGGLPSRVEMEAEGCYRSLQKFSECAWNNAEEGTPLIMEDFHRVLCDHAQELVQGFVRVKFYQLVQSHAFNELPRVSTARMPLDKASRFEETRSRARLAFLWKQGQRMGILLKSGRAVLKPQLFNNLLVGAGTGLGKSRFISVFTPTYLWLLWPWADAHAYSVNPAAVGRDAGLQQKIIRTPWWRDTFRLWWDIDEDKHAETDYRNSVGGTRKAVGWGAMIVGDRAHLQVIDDPEDPTKVFSDGERASTRDRYDKKISRRIHTGGTSIRLISQARLHQEDFSAHFMKTNPETEHLEFATVAEATPSPCQCATHRRGHTLLGWSDKRPAGASIAPRFLTEKEIAARRAAPVIFAAQDQQRPMGLAGNIFPREKWHFWRFLNEEPVQEYAARTFVIPVEREHFATWFESAVLSGDLSFGGQGDGSRDCIGIWAQKGVRKFLLPGMVWEALSFTAAQKAVRDLTKEYPWVEDRRIELAANGGAVIDSLTEGVAKEGDEGGAVEYVVQPIEGIVPVRPDGSKTYRAISISPEHEAGNLFLHLHDPRLEEMLAETAAFPRKGKGIRNDFVDMTSQAIKRLKERNRKLASTDALYSEPNYGPSGW